MVKHDHLGYLFYSCLNSSVRYKEELQPSQQDSKVAICAIVLSLVYLVGSLHIWELSRKIFPHKMDFFYNYKSYCIRISGILCLQKFVNSTKNIHT
jgi:hypothetical protein